MSLTSSLMCVFLRSSISWVSLVGWMDGFMAGWMGGCMSLTSTLLCVSSSISVFGWMDGWVDGWMDGWMKFGVSGQWVHESHQLVDVRVLALLDLVDLVLAPQVEVKPHLAHLALVLGLNLLDLLFELLPHLRYRLLVLLLEILDDVFVRNVKLLHLGLDPLVLLS
eukprot:TRINITY_DN1253_c0_g3_i1.p2 TRINITY_DN1253_c0_g3~~TRINITY_DN1253_c0_g3_i1.p2  ORF type:complete len:166 (-),score=8.80 TRINITY_DN1253_c0_g3_i1:450-947(-)